jgi:hypothetical protein
MEVVMVAAAAVAAGLTEIKHRDGSTTPLSAGDLASNGGTIPDLSQIVVALNVYDTLNQIVDEARGAYPQISANGGVRGNATPREGFPFWYGTVRDLFAAGGMELHVSLENDTPFIGERATASFYCVSKEDK